MSGSKRTHDDTSIADALAGLRIGDAHAFAVIYDAFFPSLWRLASLRTHAPDLAEDLVHEVFLALWRRRTTLPDSLDLAVYLAVAVRNQTRNVRAHDRVVGALEDAVAGARLAPPALGTVAEDASTAAEAAEFREAYERALAVLPAREREAAMLRWSGGLTFEQIAQILGMSVMGARGVILRAQQRIQADLARYR
jgi:RNA polymerase sigma-70 factor (ECF subfamily)